jgi:phosphatidylglycerol:prolipoprotein diacylglycerol transferase
MIDPIIFSFDIGSLTIALRWYGVLVMTGVLVATYITAAEFKRKGENPDHIWDALIWMIPAGMLGSRLWYVANATIGGSRYYIENPIQILNTTQGGLHFYGGLLFGALALILYTRKHKVDLWLFLDAVAPTVLIGQAVARPANFINQELYGPPTTLPWGIKIDAVNRIAPWNNINLYPVEITRFHPTFAYEMLWNLFAAQLLIVLSRLFEEKIRPGVVFYGWLLLSGVGRIIIEIWRPDQPKIPGTNLSITSLVAVLMAVFGAVLLLDKLEVIRIPFLPKGPYAYTLSATAPVGGEADEVQEA